MTRRYAGPFVTVAGLLVALAACAPSLQVQATGNLNDRMQMELAPDIEAGRAALQTLPDGTRVILLDPSLFQNGGTQLDDKGRRVLTNVIQALVDPNIIHIDVADSSAGPVGAPTSRGQAVTQYFATYGLAADLQQTVPPDVTVVTPVGATPQGVTPQGVTPQYVTPQGVTITVSVIAG